MQNNRKRAETLTIRLTKTEKEMIKKKAKKAQLSITDFLCLSLSIGIPLLKSLGFLPTMPQLNYKISALEQVLETAPLKQTEDTFHGKNLDICFDHITFGYEKAQPGPDGKPVVTMDEVITDVSFTVKAGRKTALVGESGSGKRTHTKRT